MLDIRPTTEKDLGIFVETVHTAFGRFPETPVDGGGLWWSALEAERCLLARTAEGRPVGTTASHAFELTLPGGALAPVAGVTAVGVLPTDRRQGVLTALMRHQHTALRESGEFLAVLLASEAPIYGRFGYGPATYTTRLAVRRHAAAFDAPRAGGAREAGEGVNGEAGAGGADRGTIEVRSRAGSGRLLAQVYDAYRRAQPGALSRPRRWWDLRAGMPPVSAAPRHIAVHRDADGVPDGYASYTLDSGTLNVDETVTADDAVFTALARFLLGHDLVRKAVFRHVPPGHPLRWQFADFRAGEMTEDTDWLWVRLLDVPRALTARAWAADGELVIDVDDPSLGEHHRHLLTVAHGQATCVPTDRAPDLSLDVRDLGAVYLGGTTPSALVRAGHIRAHHASAASRADALFRAERTPHCLHWF